MGKANKPVLRIRAIRESKGYTQEYMAEMLDISQSTYANLESGKTALTIERLMAIAELLDTDFFHLFEQHSNPVKKVNDKTPQQQTVIHSNPYYEAKLVYEELIRELRGEIEFLRGLIRKA